MSCRVLERNPPSLIRLNEFAATAPAVEVLQPSTKRLMPPSTRKKTKWKTVKESIPILQRLYHNPSGSVALGGANRLIGAARKEGVRPKTAKRFLELSLAYTLHKPARRRFERDRVFVNGQDEQWQANLVDMQQEARQNSGYSFWLTEIDVHSKYAWAVPIKNRTGDSLIQVFDTIFEEGRVPKKLQTDGGKEFLNKKFQNYLASKNVKHFATYNKT